MIHWNDQMKKWNKSQIWVEQPVSLVPFRIFTAWSHFELFTQCKCNNFSFFHSFSRVSTTRYRKKELSPYFIDEGSNKPKRVISLLRIVYPWVDLVTMSVSRKTLPDWRYWLRPQAEGWGQSFCFEFTNQNRRRRFFFFPLSLSL